MCQPRQQVLAGPRKQQLHDEEESEHFPTAMRLFSTPDDELRRTVERALGTPGLWLHPAHGFHGDERGLGGSGDVGHSDPLAPVALGNAAEDPRVIDVHDSENDVDPMR
jgi:hypothetical protein